MRSFYHPGSLTIVAWSTYAQAHEFAHQDQHARRTVAWRAWESTRWLPYIGYATRLAVEVEAHALAINELRACRALEPGDLWEAAQDLGSYIRGLTWL